MNGKRFTTIVLIILLTILPIISVVMMYHITLCDTMSKMDSGCFGETNVLFKVSDSFATEAMTAKLDMLDDRVALYAEKESEDFTVKSIYFNKYYVNLPMKSGRFFRKDDLIMGNQVAVIGKNLETSTYRKKDKNYIWVDGQEYEVIGVIGYEEETIIDNYVYINMLGTEESLDTIIYTLDIWGESPEVAEEYIDLLFEEGIEAEKLSETQTYGMTVFPQILYGRWFIWLFVCAFLCIAVVSGQWVKLQKHEIGIRRLVGGTVFSITCRMIARYLLYVVISMMISIIFCMVKFSGYFHLLAVGYAITIPVMLAMLIVNSISIIRTPLIEVIK